MIDLTRHASGVLYLVVLMLGGLLPAESHTDWPRWGGENGSLRTEAHLEMANGDAVSFDVAWQRDFGSGYTAITTADGLGICAAARGDGDYLIAFNLENGNTAWQFRLGDVFKGRSGSDDGPISTPIIENGVVYMLHPSGKVAAIRLGNGKPIWQLNLTETHHAAFPEYGFSTSPLIAGDVLVLPFNDEKPTTLMGVDKHTGKRIWASGSSRHGYQNPILMGPKGNQFLVFPANEAIYGIAPESGQILWEMPVEGNDSTMVAPVGENRFLYKTGRTTQLIRMGQEPKPEVVWEMPIFRNNHCQPIFYGGHLYGFDTRFLACYRIEDGALVWKSRPPGGQTIAMVDDLMLMWDAKGALTAVKATPTGYQELGRLELSNQSRIYTPPTYANGLIFLRDLTNLFAVRMRKVVNLNTSDKPMTAVNDAFTDFVNQLASSTQPGPMLEAFLQKNPQSPILTEEGWAHFYYVGESQDLAIQGDMAGFFPEVAMHRVANAPFFYRSYQMENNQKWQYRFKKFEETLLDPRNPSRVETTRGEFNTVERGHWPEPGFVTSAPQSAKGTLTQVEIPNPGDEDPIKMSVYLPASYEANTDARFPLVVFALGEQAQNLGHTVAALDQFSGSRIQPAVTVFLALHRRFWWDRFTIGFQEAMEKQIMPYLESHYRLAASPGSRTFVSREWSTKNPLLYVLKYPKRFGNIALQSPLMPATFMERELKPALPNHPDLNVYLDWGRYDAYNPSWPANVPDDAQALAQQFRDAGHAVKTAIRPGGYGWISWRTQTESMLAHFLPIR